MAMNRSTDIDPGALADLVRDLLQGRTPPRALEPAFRGRSGPLHGELRSRGELVEARWESSNDQWTALERLVLRLRLSAGRASDLFLCLGMPPRPLALDNAAGWARATANAQRGLRGYELELAGAPGRVTRVSPLAMIAQNRVFEKILGTFAARHGLSLEQARAGGVLVREFDVESFHIDLQRLQSAAARLYRGRRLVRMAEITRGMVEGLERLLTGYLVRSVQPDGRMAYLYYPSRGEEDATRNNAIRQWMATRALIRAWRRAPGDDMLGRVRRNIDYNLRAMYRDEGDLGVILDGTKVKLGAVALAALALAESPFAEELAPYERRLRATVRALWKDDGAFRTFLRPAGRSDGQNFYPGEALLLWAETIAATGDAGLLDRFWKSFEFYQRWHLAHRNPAFVPWHTQAYWKVWQRTRDQRLAPAVFLMNDWLLGVQQWETAPGPDCRGRFHDPKRPFGPPHSSSTAVYLEGLADAFALARECGDQARLESYRLAILRGLRSLAQLTIKDDLDAFYVRQCDRVRGGVRTTEYNNVIRIDNVQHALAAIEKVLDVFSDDDFAVRAAHVETAPASRPAPVASEAGPPRSIVVLDESLDVAPLLAEIEPQNALWLADTSRQRQIACQKDTETIFLRSARKPYPPETAARDVHASAETKMARHFPAAMRLAARAAERLRGELGRVLLVRLKPGGRIDAHVDKGAYYQVRHRLHVMLSAGDGTYLRCGAARLETKAGQLFWFDNKEVYEEANPGSGWSVRLIVDVLPEPRPPFGVSPYRNFALLRSGIDVGPLLAELDAKPELWLVATGRQDRIEVQRETLNIHLRGAVKPFPEGVSGNDVHPSRKARLAERCPAIYACVEACAGALGGELCRVTVVQLNPHGKVHRHIDVGEYYKVRDRYHLVLRSPGGSAMNCGDENVTFHDGELWWFNNKAPHESFNNSGEGRIHVIFDVLPRKPGILTDL
jgi:hypothetical protein